MKKPNSKAHLDAAIQRLVGTKTREARFSEIRAIVADTVVSQMLSGCAISVIDLANVKQVCVRLFAYRKTHNWQPTLSLDPRWINQYDALRGDLPVLASLDEVIAWTNDLICQIDAAQR